MYGGIANIGHGGPCLGSSSKKSIVPLGLPAIILMEVKDNLLTIKPKMIKSVIVIVLSCESSLTNIEIHDFYKDTNFVKN